MGKNQEVEVQVTQPEVQQPPPAKVTREEAITAAHAIGDKNLKKVLLFLLDVNN